MAVRKATRCPARQARMPSAIARWVLPVPGGPEQDDVLAAGEEVELAEVQDGVAAGSRSGRLKSNSSSVLRAGKRAALMRAWPPWLSRLSISVLSSVAANCS